MPGERSPVLPSGMFWPQGTLTAGKLHAGWDVRYPRTGPKSQLLACFLFCLEAFPLASGRPRSSRHPCCEQGRAAAFRSENGPCGRWRPAQSTRVPVPKLRGDEGKAHSCTRGHRGQDSWGRVVTGHEVGCTRSAPGAHGRPQSLNTQGQPRGGGIGGLRLETTDRPGCVPLTPDIGSGGLSTSAPLNLGVCKSHSRLRASCRRDGARQHL